MSINKNKTLITGGTGLLGKSLVDIFKKQHDIVATYVGEYSIGNENQVRYLKLDVQDFDGYKRLFEETRPKVVIHTASIGSPDYAEKNKEITWRINVSAMDNIISLCNECGSNLVYISSNGIYDGYHAPYAENDKAMPLNFYGMVKLEGEKLALSSRCVSAIVRPNIMYGWHHPFERSNVVTLALDKLSKNERFMAYEDVFVKPLYVEECARAILRIIEEEKYDTFNVAGCDRVSIYELIKKAAQIFGLDDGLVVPIKQGYLNELVPRPNDTSFITDKMENELKIKPIGIEEGLSIMKSKRNPRC